MRPLCKIHPWFGNPNLSGSLSIVVLVIPSPPAARHATAFSSWWGVTTGLDPDSIVNRRSNPLLATQVAFRRLNGNMP
jgi:hypothetical protein